jgi:RNA polymerase sigma factor (sigma-70 family)
MTPIAPQADGGTGAAREVGALYVALAPRLEQIVRLDVRACDAVIEDACQVAWCRLLGHTHRVDRETVLAWLARTAVHEAFKLARRDRRELSLDAAIEESVAAGPAGMVAQRASPQELLERREQLEELRGLPERQQRVVWLHALGLSYVEAAAHEGCTRRTVERQLLRARAALRDQCHASERDR